MGDGECNEGIVWETFEFISKNNINNLIIFIDCNEVAANTKVNIFGG